MRSTFRAGRLAAIACTPSILHGLRCTASLSQSTSNRPFPTAQGSQGRRLNAHQVTFLLVFFVLGRYLPCLNIHPSSKLHFLARSAHLTSGNQAVVSCRPTKHRGPTSLAVSAAAAAVVAPAPTYDVSSHSKEHLTIGTIGHVDHGKTTLTAAITRVQPAEILCTVKL